MMGFACALPILPVYAARILGGLINGALTARRHVGRMVTRPRLRSFFTGLGLYLLAAALIGYFGLNAYSGDHGLRARQQMDKQIASLSDDLAQASAERDTLQRRIKLLKSDSVDPDRDNRPDGADRVRDLRHPLQFVAAVDGVRADRSGRRDLRQRRVHPGPSDRDAG